MRQINQHQSKPLRNKLMHSLRYAGYSVVPELFDAATVTRLQQICAAILPQISSEHRRLNRSQGSLVNLADYPAFADIIAHPGLLDLLASIAFAKPVFSSGYLISKPPHSPPLFWHQDWWGWDDALSYSDTIAQVFIMIYLTQTAPDNGCLRVIPGSHRRRHVLHKATAAHAESLSQVLKPQDPLYQSSADERAVAVKPGDVVVGDARLLHGAYANDSQQERSLLTLWYHPDYSALPARMQARIQAIFCRQGVDTDPGGVERQLLSDWPDQQRDKVAPLFPAYDGTAPPHDWNRQPDLALLLPD